MLCVFGSVRESVPVHVHSVRPLKIILNMYGSKITRLTLQTQSQRVIYNRDVFRGYAFSVRSREHARIHVYGHSRETQRPARENKLTDICQPPACASRHAGWLGRTDVHCLLDDQGGKKIELRGMRNFGTCIVCFVSVGWALLSYCVRPTGTGEQNISNPEWYVAGYSAKRDWR